jgi:hypothetical protein
MFYQNEGLQIVDYQLFQLEGCDEHFRGPRMALEERKYIAFVGAAQTFGTFCRHPFPDLVVERTGLAGLNLGIGGAGPHRFLQDPVLMKFINGSRLAIVQVLSGRSAPNSLIRSPQGTNSAVRLDRPTDPPRWSEYIWQELLNELPRDRLLDLIAETRDQWATSMRELLSAITVPKILLWMSSRPPDYTPRFDSVWSLLGEFPQFVDRAALQKIIPLADSFVDATCSRGYPQRLFDKYKGSPTSIKRPDGDWWENTYYPSPEMHVETADRLTPAISAILKPLSPSQKSDASQAPSIQSARQAQTAILLSHERSGSHLLKHLLDSSGRIVSTGEVCNLRYVREDDPISFFGFRRRAAQSNPNLTIPLPENVEILLDAYFKQVASTVDGEIALLDIKYGHAHHFYSFQHWVLGWDNVFVDFLKSRGVKVIHLYRKDLFAAVASAHLATAIQQWNSQSGTVAGAQVTISKDYFFPQLLRLASSIISWRERLKTLEPFSISYEELVEGAENGHPKVLEAARYLGASGNWTPTAPDTKMSPPVADYITNFDELTGYRELFANLDLFEAMISGNPKFAAQWRALHRLQSAGGELPQTDGSVIAKPVC